MAFGKPIFVEFAFNLALSIRTYCPNYKIQLIHDDYIKELGDRANFFDILTPIDRADFWDGKRIQAGVAKCNLYKYLHFEETLYLDVDGLVLKDITQLFEQEQDFKIQADGMHWLNSNSQVERYGVNEAIGSNSSVMFIRKGDTAKALFDEALKAINEPIDDIRNGWFGMHPDELYLGIAMAKLGLKDVYFKGKYPWYLRKSTDNVGFNTFDEVKENHYGLGVYGNFTYNHHLSYKLYNRENNANWQKFLKRSSPIKVDKLMKLKR